MTSDWTLETLKEHLEVQLADLRRSADERHEANTVALNAALQASDARFAGVNEFRATLADQATQFITRSEAIAAIDRNTERVEEIRARVDLMAGNSLGLNAGWRYLLGLIAALGTMSAIAFALFR